jgi:hypothetical protein
MGAGSRNLILALWEKNKCPYCRKIIAEGERVGSGQKAKGGFCSLNCYAEYYKLELSERARFLAQKSQVENH